MTNWLKSYETAMQLKSPRKMWLLGILSLLILVQKFLLMVNCWNVLV